MKIKELFKKETEKTEITKGLPKTNCDIPTPEVKPPLSCFADQPNKECSLVEQLREKQKELNEVLKKYNTIIVGFDTKRKFEQILKYYDEDSRYSYINNNFLLKLTYGQVAIEDAKVLSDALLRYVDEMNKVDILNKKVKKLKSEIAILKQQLDIE